MSARRVIETARGELGVCEEPSGSNRVKYWDAYDKAFQGQPWCVAFLWWCFHMSGESAAFFGGGKTTSCGMLLRWYREQGLTVPVDEVRIGDIVLLNFNGKGTADHCGLVECVMRMDDGPEIVWTVEGNTSSGDGSQDNGGCVARKMRNLRQIVAVCRPQYTPEPEIVDDITGHWAEDTIRWCMERGLMVGYPDGSFQPDKPVTRAELATVLRRMEEMT